jgi:hypothetical protein
MQNMKLRCFVLALVLSAPSAALADPFTVGGVWSKTADPLTNSSGAPLSVEPFWAGISFDCPTCGVGFLLGAFEDGDLEYLHDGRGGHTPFWFNEPLSPPTMLFNITALMGGTLGVRSDGAFTYTYAFGTINSIDDFGQFALFRLVEPDKTRYFLGVEDILITEVINDRDYNDYVATFTPVPEPSTLLLMGGSLAVMAARKKLRRRKERT